MTFREKLQTLKENHESPKLEDVKSLLEKRASEGKNFVILYGASYDTWIVTWLKDEGLEVQETFDQREGRFLRVSW